MLVGVGFPNKGGKGTSESGDWRWELPTTDTARIVSRGYIKVKENLRPAAFLLFALAKFDLGDQFLGLLGLIWRENLPGKSPAARFCLEDGRGVSQSYGCLSFLTSSLTLL